MPRDYDPVDALRPTSLAEFTGQPEVSRDLAMVLGAAAKRSALPDHMLFFGPPGTGKTTLAHIIGAEVGLPVVTVSGPAISKPVDITNMLTSLSGPSVVFIDEVHALPRAAEEHLYSAMEDGVLDITMGEGARARVVRYPLERFVLVAATTQAGKVTGPLRSRFGYQGRLRLYDVAELATIVTRSARMLGLALGTGAAEVIAGRSRGTPRIANNLTRRVRDYAWHDLDTDPTGPVEVDAVTATAALDAFGVDTLGLDSMARDLVYALCVHFAGGPVGGASLAARVGESLSTLEDVYEPYLMHIGVMVRTPRGRMATPSAYEHLGLVVPEGLAATA